MSKIQDDILSIPPKVPSTLQPRAEFTDDSALIVTESQVGLGEDLTDEQKLALLAENGQDPEKWEVARSRVSSWQTASGEWRTAYKFEYAAKNARPTVDLSDLEAIIKRAKKQAAPKSKVKGDPYVYVTSIADCQAGKADGPGIDGIISNVIESIDRSVSRLKQLQKTYNIDTVYLCWLGDVIEGVVSQGGANVTRLDITLTEQVRLIRRLKLYQIDAFRGLVPNIKLLAVGGNHDETHRVAGKGITRYDDSWAHEIAVSVYDALQCNKPVYGHIEVLVPEKDEITLTVDAHGTILGLFHGHLAGSSPESIPKWLAGQSLGRQPIGNADVLLTGHWHHLIVKELTAGVTWIQVPSTENESTWWRHRTGGTSTPGTVSFITRDGEWSELYIA